VTEQQFESWVERLTQQAQRRPFLFRLQVLGLVAIGLVYVGILALLALIASVGMAALVIIKPILFFKLAKLAWVPVVFAWSVLRALWVRLPEPSGRRLLPAEAPELFAELRRVRAVVSGPMPDRVLITDDYNASVLQWPRLGVFGWDRNYLILGLPLMTMLSAEQLGAVIAHEFGHLGAGDSRITRRVYRMRRIWGQLQDQFKSRGSFLVRRFFDWYGPRFNAYTLVLARRQEYAADEASALYAGRDAAASALVLAAIGTRYQEDTVWQPIWRRLPEDTEPTATPFTELLRGGGRSGDWQDGEQQLQQALQRRTDWSDTHPALVDRLAGIGARPAVPPPAGTSAAEVFLGALAPKLAQELDGLWQRHVDGDWRRRHQELRAEREELAALRAKTPPLDRDGSWRLAWLTESVDGADAALPLYEAHRTEYPDAYAAIYAIGRIMLARRDEAGLALLDQAIAGDGALTKPAAEAAHRYLKAAGRHEDAKHYETLWLERDRLEAEADAERAQFTPKDRYIAHPLGDELRAALRQRLSAVKTLAGAWLLAKQVRHFPEQPALLMFVKAPWWRFVKASKLRSQVEAALPEALAGRVTLAVYNRDLKALFKAVKRVQGGRVDRV